jgi:CRISPR-associated endonuclease/helicase Cas3
MSPLPDFTTFFRGIWNHDPFPWQTMLVERIAAGCWPQALDLPTATGKTACMDAAIYALACQADRPTAERTAARRIWFVVDRRIVVDEAYDRAETIARKLRNANGGPLKQVADRLRQISGTQRPLAVGRLRGGILRDDGWARLPSQPAVITSTVDQLGSRLLFRGYGRSHLAAPIFAGLGAHDSLILLDEAHCSVPFLQTLRTIETYRGEAWAESELRTPFAVAILSATPPPGIPDSAIFPGTAREAALDHPVLRDRLGASKVARLLAVKAARAEQSDPLVAAAAKRAESYVRDGCKRRVAVIVNRVRTAEEIAHALRAEVEERADVVLLTGRIRPFERDRLVEKWKPFLRAASPDEPENPIVLVSTQCIEVGADFSFDALVTECASLDALRQRFGRVNRMGLPGAAPATILIRNEDAQGSEPDPIYGTALSAVWRLLSETATAVAEGKKQQLVIDFGVESLDAALNDVEDFSPYLAPRPDAPILLPAHLDFLVQTAPTPHPEPDIQPFLHGKDQGAPEARVIWRADLSEENTEVWTETLALCPPSSGEVLSVPLYRLRRWLAAPDGLDDAGDVEGVSSSNGDSEERLRACLIWRGRERSRICRAASHIVPDDVVVVPCTYGIAGLGQSAVAEAMGEQGLDLWEPVRTTTGRPPALRLHPAVLEPWLACPPIKDLVELVADPAWERETLQQAIDVALDYQPPDDDAATAPPPWLLELLGAVRYGRAENHPGGGVVLFARDSARNRSVCETDLFADDDDVTSASDLDVSLETHTASVERAVKRLAARCLPDGFLDPLRLAAHWHDIGKLDERFQILLRQGDELAAVASEPLAKSSFVPGSPGRRRVIRETSGLPSDFRHEVLSVQLVAECVSLTGAEETLDLVLHLIASHHGHARPFAPVSPDSDPPAVSGRLGDAVVALTAEQRRGLIPMHRLDSGLPERFWRLTRRYGWWGLAYLEAILRLGDWYGSQFITDDNPDSEVTS